MSIYWGKSFFGFLVTFFSRLVPLLTGKVEIQSDEVQIFALCLMSIMSVTVGLFLVVRKMAMVANAITHTVLLGITLAVICGYFISGVHIGVMDQGLSTAHLLFAALVTSVLTMTLIEVLCSKFHVQKDVSIGLVFTFLFAIGIVLATIFTRNSHIGTEVITGNIDLISFDDLRMISILTGVILTTIAIFWKPLVISSFDVQFASIAGISHRALNYLIVILTSLTVIISMRAVGVVLVLSLLIAPFLISRLFFDSLKMILLSSVGVGVSTSVISVALARHFLSVHGVPLSTSGLVVAILFLFWTTATLFSPTKGIVGRKKRFADDLNIDFSNEG